MTDDEGMSDDDRTAGDEQKLRRAYALHLKAEGARLGREHCVAPEALLALVERRGSEAERLATLDHAGSCEACRHDLELLRAVHLAGTARSDQPARHGRSWMTMSRGRLAAAAALLITVAAVATTLRRDDAVMRGGARLTLVSPAGDLRAGEPVILTWRAMPGADRYEVELLGVAGDSIFAVATLDTLVRLPESVLLVAEGEYLWSVRAVLRDGTHAAADPLRFRVRQR